MGRTSVNTILPAPFPVRWATWAAATVTAWAAMTEAWARDVVFFPTPQPVVAKMLEMAEIQPDDVLIDLGSGDGRIPITAAREHGIKALGVELDADLVKQSRESATKDKVADKVEFREHNLFDTDLSGASVITLFLSHSINMKLRPRLQALKPGTRIVSYGFAMGDWTPDRTEQINGRFVYLWIIRPGTGSN
jgi:precorrin-6B methylase 2